MRKNEFDIHKINGENMVKSFIYAHMGRYTSKHTWDNQATLKKNEKKQETESWENAEKTINFEWIEGSLKILPYARFTHMW